MKNKTEQTMHIRYSDFVAQVSGAEIAGALRVPFVRINPKVKLLPNEIQGGGQPVEFVGVPSDLSSMQVVLQKIELTGSEPSTFTFDVPLRGRD